MCIYTGTVFPTGVTPQEGETKLPAKDIEELKKRMKPPKREELAEAEWWRRHTVTSKG